MPWPPPPSLPPQPEDVLDLAGALADLARAARETRTTLWSALQVCLILCFEPMSLHISKSEINLIFALQATQLVELDREVATGLRKLEEELSCDGEEIKDSEEIKDLSRNGEEIKDSPREESKEAEELDTRGSTDQETKKETPND